MLEREVVQRTGRLLGGLVGVGVGLVGAVVDKVRVTAVLVVVVEVVLVAAATGVLEHVQPSAGTGTGQEAKGHLLDE